MGGGAKWPTANQKRYISGTKCPIDLKPGCKFMFVRCLETYLKKIDQFGPWRDPAGPFFTKGPQKLASLGPFRGPFGGPWRSRRVPWALVQLDNDQISVPTWLEGLENTKYRKTQNFLKNHEIFAKIIRSISGAV